MMESKKADLILDICLSFYNDIDIYGKNFEKLKIDRPYVDIIKTGFDIILNGKGADVFEIIIDSEIQWFTKSNTTNKEMIFELLLFKKFWIISEKKGRSALAEFILSTISPELYQKHMPMINALNIEKDPLDFFSSETIIHIR